MSSEPRPPGTSSGADPHDRVGLLLAESELVYRPVQEDDAEAVHDVALEGWRYAYGHLLTEEFIAERVGEIYARTEIAAAAKATAAGDAAFWVADDGGRAVGFAYFADRGEGPEMVRLYVLPAYFERGVGSRLMEIGEKYFRRRGADAYFCYVHPENKRAMRFYTRRGFYHVPERDKEKPYLWHMRKELASEAAAR